MAGVGAPKGVFLGAAAALVGTLLVHGASYGFGAQTVRCAAVPGPRRRRRRRRAEVLARARASTTITHSEN